MRRVLVIGELAVIRPDAVEALQREGYRNVQARVPAKIVNSWMQGRRRVFVLDIDCDHVSGHKTTTVWADQAHLADGPAERYLARRAKRIAEMVTRKETENAAKLAAAERRAARKSKKAEKPRSKRK